MSVAQQKQLKRAVELDKRAQAIHNKDKRSKENAKKKTEKDQREKETRSRMGVEEEIKLPEGQLGLGHFFKTKTAGSTVVKVPSQKMLILEENEPVTGSGDVESECENSITLNVEGHSMDDELRDKHIEHDISLQNSILGRDQSYCPAATTSEGNQCTDHQRWPDEDVPYSHQRPTEQQSESRSPPLRLDKNTIDDSDLPVNPTDGEQATVEIKRPSFFANYEAYMAAKEARSAPTSRQLSPEVKMPGLLVHSIPGTATKRKLNATDFDRINQLLEQDTTREDTSHPKKPRSDSRCSERHPQQTSQASSANSGLPTADQTVGIYNLVRTSGAAQNSQYRPSREKTPAPADSSPGCLADDDMYAMDLDDLAIGMSQLSSSMAHKRSPSITDSFGVSICDDDLLEAEAAEATELISNCAVPVIDRRAMELNMIQNGRTNESVHNPTSLKSHQPTQRCPSPRAPPSYSFGCDFSLHDLAFIEKDLLPPSTNPSLREQRVARFVSSQSKAAGLQTTPDIREDRLFDDEFDFAGFTQDLLVLAEEDENDDVLLMDRTISQTHPRSIMISSTVGDKSAMLPPPLPNKSTNKVAESFSHLSSSEDEFDCFKGSTQALLDL